MSELALKRQQVVRNIYTLNEALNVESERKKAISLLKNGKIFVAIKVEDDWLFAPSRFAGYKSNSISQHEKAKLEDKRDGKITEKAFDKFTKLIQVGQSGYDILDEHYLSLCSNLSTAPSRHHRFRRYRIFDVQKEHLEFDIKENHRELTIDDHAKRIAQTVSATVKNSGKKRTAIAKLKTTNLSEKETQTLVTALMKSQKGRCKLTNLKILLNGDASRFPSLDRIDSDLHYQTENLQLVCKFINHWKSDRSNDEFLRLIELVRNS